MTRILVAMSGGVDSSVAAALLVEAGHDVVGVTMKTFCYGDTPHAGRSCCGLDGIHDARRVSERLGIPHYVFDVEEEFTRHVIDDFVSEYAAGRTPNPCVRCNSETKFEALLRRGRALGCDRIASGHYVRRREGPDGAPWLLRGLDPDKDQAYFLWGLSRALLPRLEFPLGELTKPRVRDIARSLDLVTAEKPESQEICFVPTGDYRDLLRRRLSPVHAALRPGDIVTEDGTVVGRHDGYAGFTIGQRKGLGGGFPEPMYVIEIRPETRQVVIGPEGALGRDHLRVEDLNWLADEPEAGSRVAVQIRHRATPLDAEVLSCTSDGLDLRLDGTARAASPGQSAVVFRDERVLGGGRIRSRLAARSAVEAAYAG